MSQLVLDDQHQKCDNPCKTKVNYWKVKSWPLIHTSNNLEHNLVHNQYLYTSKNENNVMHKMVLWKLVDGEFSTDCHEVFAERDGWVYILFVV